MTKIVYTYKVDSITNQVFKAIKRLDWQDTMNLGDLAVDALKQYRSTPDVIAHALREAILRGVIKGGEQLHQEEIANQFKVSRIPVREALRQLEAEGLVTFYPNRGAIVSQLSVEEAQEIFEIRVALETTAIQLAIPHLTEQDLRRTELIVVAERDADTAHWGELNWDFHSALYTPARRPRLLGMIKNLHTNVDPYLRIQLAATGYKDKPQEEHEQILEACRNRDIAKAVELTEQHIVAAGEQLVSYLKQTIL